MVVKRKKKWLGALVSGVVNTGLGILSAKRQRDAQEEALREQQRVQTQQLAMQNAANLTSKYADTSYADVMQDKISFKAGGKTKDRVAVAKIFACGGRKKNQYGSLYNYPDEDIKDEDKVSDNYVYRYPYLAHYLENPLYNSDQLELVKQGKKDIADRIMQTRVNMGNKIINTIANFTKNDSAVYTPLLDMTDRYLQRLYDKREMSNVPYTNNELSNIDAVSKQLYNLSLRKANPYNKNHEYVNNILTKLSDEEISKLLNTNYFGKDASIIDAAKSKPKSISWWQAYKLYDIMNTEYFNDNFRKKALGGSYNEINDNTITNIDNIVKSNIGLKMARMGAKYKRKCSK